MSRSSPKMPLNWDGCGVLALLGGAVVLGLVMQGLTWLQFLASLGFAAGLLLVGVLWQWSLRRARATPPLTPRQRLWNAVVFLLLLAVLAGLVLWLVLNRPPHGRQTSPGPTGTWPDEPMPAGDK